jgi:hypothetical protein
MPRCCWRFYETEVDPYVAKLVAQSTALQLRLDEAAKEKLTDATDKKNW